MDGDFNIENALAAIGVGRMLGAEHEQMAAAWTLWRSPAA